MSEFAELRGVLSDAKVRIRRGLEVLQTVELRLLQRDPRFVSAPERLRAEVITEFRAMMEELYSSLCDDLGDDRSYVTVSR